MQIRKLVAPLCLAALCAAPVAAAATSCGAPIAVAALLNESVRYEGKVVGVVGKLHLAFENDNLSIDKVSIRLDFFNGPEYTDESVTKDKRIRMGVRKKFQGRCVVVKGVAGFGNRGLHGMPGAILEHIESVEAAKANACAVPAKQP
jgi:hypothetical protein